MLPLSGSELYPRKTSTWVGGPLKRPSNVPEPLVSFRLTSLSIVSCRSWVDVSEVQPQFLLRELILVHI